MRKLAEALGVEVRDLFPKGQSPLPFEALEAADDPAEWLEEHCGHAHLALRSAEELEAMVSGPNAEVNFKALQEEYAAVTKHMDPLMTLRLDPAARFMRAWAAYVLHQKRSGASEEEIGERTVEMAANLAATGAA